MHTDAHEWGRWLGAWGPGIVVIALAGGFMAVAVATLGGSLGVFLAGIAVVTVLGPFVPRGVWGVVGVVAAAWLVTVVRGQVRFVDWFEAVVLLTAYAAAVAGLASVMRWDGAAGVVVVVGLLWLTWPFWMSSFFRGADSEHIVAALVWGHPTFAINGIMDGPPSVPWAQHRIAYEQTNIGDDVPYAMPRGVWPSVVLHGGLALLCLAIRLIPSRLRAPATPASPASAGGSG
jgi:hypothetical protein